MPRGSAVFASAVALTLWPPNAGLPVVLPYRTQSFEDGGCYFAEPSEFDLVPGTLRWEGDVPVDLHLSCEDGGRIVHLAPGDALDTRSGTRIAAGASTVADPDLEGGCRTDALSGWEVGCMRTGSVARCDFAHIDVTPGIQAGALSCGETLIPIEPGRTWIDPGPGCDLVSTDAFGQRYFLDRVERGEQWRCWPMAIGVGCYPFR